MKPTFRDILTTEEKEQVYNLQASILSAKSRREVKKIRNEINEILEQAKVRYEELNNKEQAGSLERVITKSVSRYAEIH